MSQYDKLIKYKTYNTYKTNPIVETTYIHSKNMKGKYLYILN